MLVTNSPYAALGLAAAYPISPLRRRGRPAKVTGCRRILSNPLLIPPQLAQEIPTGRWIFGDWKPDSPGSQLAVFPAEVNSSSFTKAVRERMRILSGHQLVRSRQISHASFHLIPSDT